MSEIKVNKISPRSGTTVTLGDSGDTFTIPSGATINNQGTATNFGATGSASWTTTVKTSTFTAVAGEGYFVDTSSNPVTVNLPAGTAGAVVAISDYAKNFATNACTLVQNGSDKIGGSAINGTLETNGMALTLIFIDSTKGWIVTDDGNQSTANTNPYMVATGGTESTCGNYKIHTFNSPGCFSVSKIASCAADNKLDYLVVAGGGGGGGTNCTSAGGGGGGGLRFYANTPTNPQAANPSNPINNFPAGTTITATAASFPITVAGGGAGGPNATDGPTLGTNGNVSTFSTVTSSGGGAGHGYKGGQPMVGNPGGSGGAGSYGGAGGNGNDPSTSPAQGNDGGAGDNSPQLGGGGGGAISAGTTASPSTTGNGGAGAGFTGFGASNGQCSSCKQYFSGGGGGGSDSAFPAGGTGGLGGGGVGGRDSAGTAGTDNTGGGGGGRQNSSGSPGFGTGGNGGSGIVIIRYRFQ